jgi:hypothetical protein
MGNTYQPVDKRKIRALDAPAMCLASLPYGYIWSVIGDIIL